MVRCWTRDRKVAGSTPSRGAIKSTRSTQPSILQGWVNRVPACMAGIRRDTFTCVGWHVTLCDPIWQVTSRSSEVEEPYRPLLYFSSLSDPIDGANQVHQFSQQTISSCFFFSFSSIKVFFHSGMSRHRSSSCFRANNSLCIHQHTFICIIMHIHNAFNIQCMNSLCIHQHAFIYTVGQKKVVSHPL